jgi:hypothetical protein
MSEIWLDVQWLREDQELGTEASESTHWRLKHDIIKRSTCTLVPSSPWSTVPRDIMIRSFVWMWQVAASVAEFHTGPMSIWMFNRNRMKSLARFSAQVCSRSTLSQVRRLILALVVEMILRSVRLEFIFVFRCLAIGVSPLLLAVFISPCIQS